MPSPGFRMWRLILPILLCTGSRIQSSPTPRPAARNKTLAPLSNFVLEGASINEMFKEVEELMEDTQHKLQDALREMEIEQENSINELLDIPLDKLPSDYHNESNRETKIGNATIYTHQKIDKATNNKTGSVAYSETIITSMTNEDGKRNRECILDEDCGAGTYCLSTILETKCLPCKPEDMNCTRDGECCEEHLCVWGQCAKNVTKGQGGTICENQHDCNTGTCCAFQTNLLFPVCSSLPTEGNLCYDPTNRLIDQITWELEPDGALYRCPCVKGLICQPQGHALDSVCTHPSSNVAKSQDRQHSLKMDKLPFLNLTTRDIVDDFDNHKASNILQEISDELDNFWNNRV
ncbi:dickkopf-related protein 3 [Latimeria chalumnae]|uniref:Dickkopf-related protein 3 n=1 Tax=Latimeria chalumnae TaxID=7897 RepID=H3ASD8_LATCH|nr:PREDICTED: dickkopf-related protein 3 [Latimeria chalumnae]XP_006001039.1 PREDICTED: dickkopf-related protein 3 [Latimeria chalumnae]|eukprot:XP_006001038.1 PREDICTED: dickkopf-related protein 3 [Latimeria chalumnae]